MPRTKGSKNRTKSDIASQIAEKQSVIQTFTAEVDAIQKDIEEKKADLKEKKTALKKTEAEAVLKKLLAGGMSVDEILEKLK